MLFKFIFPAIGFGDLYIVLLVDIELKLDSHSFLVFSNYIFLHNVSSSSGSYSDSPGAACLES